MSGRKKFFIIILAGMLFWPLATRAAAEASAEANPLCWKKIDCVNARRPTFVGATGVDAETKAAEGWIQDAPGQGPCTGDYGRCIAGSLTKTEISFGGQRQFADIGVFLTTIYNYGVGIASIVAVIMIIVAGFQWVVSGGSAETITSAKKRIGGAMMGLFIAFLSYVILNTVSPALVNLRLPQVWMIRTITLTPKFCVDAFSSGVASDSTNDKPLAFALAGEQGSQIKTEDIGKTPFDKVIPKDLWCQYQYFMSGGGPLVCYGTACSAGNQVCTDFNFDKDRRKPYSCQNGYLAGRISGFGDSLKIETVDGPIKLMAICPDGKVIDVDEIPASSINKNIKPPGFILGPKDAKNFPGICDSGVPKFFIAAEINDESGGLGGAVEGAPTSFGCDDWFAIGKSGKNSHLCNVNLAKKANELSGLYPGIDCTSKQILSYCSCRFSKYNKLTTALYNQGGDFLFSDTDLLRGYTCNLDINRNEFPSLDNFNNGTCLVGFVGGFMGGAAGSIVPVAGTAVGGKVGYVVTCGASKAAKETLKCAGSFIYDTTGCGDGSDKGDPTLD